MRRPGHLLALLALFAGLLFPVPQVAGRPSTPEGTQALSTRSFQTPSENIVCHLQRGRPKFLRCDIRSGLNPEPDRDCDLDWVGLLLPSQKRARANCAGDTVPNQDPEVLEYGKRWERGRFSCVSRRSGLGCQNASGYHFKLSRDDWSRWYRP